MGTPEDFRKYQEETDRPVSWEGLGPETKRPAVEAVRTENEIKKITREVESATLAPSMIERCFRTIFEVSTGEYTHDVHKNYIAPLKTPAAKMVMKAILIHASHHPEELRKLGPEITKTVLVMAANGIAYDIDEQEKGHGKMTTEQILTLVTNYIPGLAAEIVKSADESLRPEKKEINEHINSLREQPKVPTDELIKKGRMAAERMFPNKDSLPSRPEKITEEMLDSLEKPPKGLTYFPGMPGFTAHLKRLGYDNFSLVKVEIDRNRMTPDEEVYEIYFSATNRGRYTIRRKGGVGGKKHFIYLPGYWRNFHPTNRR